MLQLYRPFYEPQSSRCDARDPAYEACTKGYAMDGWRMGYAVASERFMKDLLKMSMNDMAHVNVFSQEGGHAAISGSQDCVDKWSLKIAHALIWYALECQQWIGWLIFLQRKANIWTKE